MCVIVYKPQGQSFDYDDLELCFQSNPDLAGISICNPSGNIVHNHRGLTFHELLAAIPENEEDYAIALHFRIATSGIVNTYNSHPFPICCDLIKCEDILKSKMLDTRAALIHNGVLLSNKEVVAYRNGSKQSLSDTGLLAIALSSVNDEYRLILLDMLSSGMDKFCYITPTRIKLFGPWHTKGGLFYSNLTWQYSGVSWNAYESSGWAESYCTECGAYIIPKNRSTGLCRGCQVVLGIEPDDEADDRADEDIKELVSCWCCGYQSPADALILLEDGFLVCDECYQDYYDESIQDDEVLSHRI